MTIRHGISENKLQIILQLIQVFLVGLTIGMTRTVIPGLADTEFGLGSQQFLLLTSFVVVFGVVKAIMNLLAGKLSDTYGRKRVLVTGWVVAIPIPLMILYAPSWNWIVAATLLLGVNQGLCWSMTINSKLDLARLNQKGLVNGINEFSGYAAVAIAGVITAYIVDFLGARQGLFIFGVVVIFLGLISSIFSIKETMPWAKLHQVGVTPATHQSLGKLFIQASWHDKVLLSLNQAGLVEKFTDAMVWIFLPVFFLSKNLTLIEGSAIVSVYAVVWGGSQLITGPLSDKIGRKVLIVGGMWICGLGLLSIPYTNNIFLWTLEAGVIGTGMAMLYPTLGAAVADFAPVESRGTLLGIYRFWRDFGYAVSALTLGMVAQMTQVLIAPFLLASTAMILSGLYVLIALPSTQIQK
ncbi:major facilitator family transporter [endosymbiont of Bathymodiolus septemdierum str. Myojin knoll]|uniref:Major facilitator family transporter n=2 Tax=sulfur-oxidizing symbionts TaxID=32036 RepID=A0A0P0UTK7_9GAMM|nr:major facilitator family transporter [endosymbiont of Bathymodiolus septemdierum str. Myojin knoll]